MVENNQKGGVNCLAVSLVLTIVLLVAALVFGVWAYSSRQDYKNNVQAKINAAVLVAKNAQSALDQQQNTINNEKPLITYKSPQEYGSLIVQYPRSWSAYVDDSGQGAALVDGYFQPGVVPSISSNTSVFALRVQVINQAYPQVVQQFNSAAQNGTLTVKAYSLHNVPSVVGVEVSGIVSSANSNSTLSTTMVVLPLRTYTLEIWTQGTQYLNEFNQDILPNFSFSP